MNLSAKYEYYKQMCYPKNSGRVNSSKKCPVKLIKIYEPSYWLIQYGHRNPQVYDDYHYYLHYIHFYRLSLFRPFTVVE